MGLNTFRKVEYNEQCSPRGCLIPSLHVFFSINHLLYADDICITSLSSTDLQQLLINTRNDYCDRHDLIFNAKKVNVYVFLHCFEQTLRILCNLCGKRYMSMCVEKLSI